MEHDVLRETTIYSLASLSSLESVLMLQLFATCALISIKLLPKLYLPVCFLIKIG